MKVKQTSGGESSLDGLADEVTWVSHRHDSHDYGGIEPSFYLTGFYAILHACTVT